MENILAGSMAVVILMAPLFLMPLVMDFLLTNRPVRAIARRLFRIDATATLANLPELPAHDASR